MALKPLRQTHQTNIECTVSGVSERGGILSYDPVANGLCLYADATAVSGQLTKAAGLLLEDIEALNFHRHPQYHYRNVSPQGSVVGIATEGEFEIDFVETTGPGGIPVGTYKAGDLLYLADDGNVSRNDGSGTGVTREQIGKALGTVDSDGFLKIRLEL